MFYKSMGKLASQRVCNLDNERYIKEALKLEGVEKIEALPVSMQIGLEREAAYLKGLVDGIRLGWK